MPAKYSQTPQDYIETLAPPEIKESNGTAVQETTFTELNFEQENGPKIGTFEAVYKANNLEDKWTQAYNVLKSSNATIKDRYHSEDYQYSYWLYEGNKIYRQKRKNLNSSPKLNMHFHGENIRH
jgi:hypothetical protein